MIRSLRRHSVPALMLVLEMALACAVLGNVLHMLEQRFATIHRADQIDEDSLAFLTIDNRDASDNADTISRELLALKAIPGVSAVAQSNALPLSHDVWGGALRVDPATQDWTDASCYILGLDGSQVLGLKLVQGRDFRADDYAAGDIHAGSSPTAPVVILSESLARRLWPGQSPLGKLVYDSEGRHTVIGVAKDVLVPEIGVNGPNGNYYAAFYPSRTSMDMRYDLVRTDPRQMPRVLRQAQQALDGIDPHALIAVRDFVSERRDYFASDRSMVWMLSLVSAVMLAATALGVVGLTSFWVGQRRGQIGIRRALGARRRDVLAYFQGENLLLSVTGGGLGMLLGYGLNLYLMRHYEFGHLPAAYLWSGACILLLLGQLAVLGPALKASRISPVVAMRG
ncbi:ABC transporter permease [Frateuria aurantia]